MTRDVRDETVFNKEDDEFKNTGSREGRGGRPIRRVTVAPERKMTQSVFEK
jgi:hypothetical protein